jgi:hypothetical protein
MKTPILGLLVGTIFFAACSGPPPPPPPLGAEFIGEWGKISQYSDGAKFVASIKITHNIDNQYFFSPSMSATLRDGSSFLCGDDSQRSTAIYRDGIMVLQWQHFVLKCKGTGRSDTEYRIENKITIDKAAGKIFLESSGDPLSGEFTKK